MIVTASCRAKSNPERVREYQDRVQERPGFNYQIHASRIAKGVRRQGELVRLPIPRHRALIVVEN